MDSASTRDGGRRPRTARPADQEPRPSGSDLGWGITGTLLSGLIVWGAAGWLVDRWLDTRVFIVVGGIVGLAVAIYLVAVKYGGATDQPTTISSTSYSKISSSSYSTYRRTPGGRRSRPRTQKGQR